MASMIQEKIKAGDLRIGNWVRHKDSNLLGTVIIIENYIEYITCEMPDVDHERFEGDRSEFEPIPLSEDWLKKFGFTDRGHKFFVKDDIELGYITTDEHLQMEFCFSGTGKWPIIDVKYCHQFQNLYYALCGKELTINNEK